MSAIRLPLEHLRCVVQCDDADALVDFLAVCGDALTADARRRRGLPEPTADREAKAADDRRRIGLFVRDRREALNLSQRELAQRLSISQIAISRAERGDGAQTSRAVYDLLERWANDLGQEPAPTRGAAARKAAGDEIRAAREAHGITQQQLADHIRCSRKVVSVIKLGDPRASWTTIDRVLAWARAQAPREVQRAASPPREAAATSEPADEGETVQERAASQCSGSPAAPTVPAESGGRKPAPSVSNVRGRAGQPGPRKQPMRKKKAAPWERGASSRPIEPATPRVLPAHLELHDCPPYKARLTVATCDTNRKRAREGDTTRDLCRECPGVLKLSKRPQAAA